MAGSRAKRQRRAEEYETHTLLIEDWSPSYSFALNHNRRSDTPYWEALHIKVTAKFLAPDRPKDRHLTLTLMGNRDEARALEEPLRCKHEPLCVGTLTIRGDRTDYLGSVPQDALWALLSLMSSGAVRMIQLHGPALYRGEARIISISFDRDIDPGDW